MGVRNLRTPGEKPESRSFWTPWGVEMKDSSCQVSSLTGLILTQCAGDIFIDAKVLGAEFGWMSKTASGQLGKVKGPPVFMINKGPGYSPTNRACSCGGTGRPNDSSFCACSKQALKGWGTSWL